MGGKTCNIAIFAAMLQNFGFFVYDGFPHDVAKEQNI